MIPFSLGPFKKGNNEVKNLKEGVSKKCAQRGSVSDQTLGPKSGLRHCLQGKVQKGFLLKKSQPQFSILPDSWKSTVRIFFYHSQAEFHRFLEA